MTKEANAKNNNGHQLKPKITKLLKLVTAVQIEKIKRASKTTILYYEEGALQLSGTACCQSSILSKRNTAGYSCAYPSVAAGSSLASA